MPESLRAPHYSKGPKWQSPFPRPRTWAPEFTLRRDGGGSVSLADFDGRSVVLYFYPRADTTGCTREALDFSRLKGAFTRPGTEIVGISADSAAPLDPFKSKHKLTIALVSIKRARLSKPMAYGSGSRCTGENSWAPSAPPS